MGVGDSPEAHEIPDDLLRNDSSGDVFTPDDVRQNSPKSLSLVELKSERDLDIFRKIYDHSIRIGDNAPAGKSPMPEFNMTNDSKHFPPLEKWEAKGYKPDVFGRWIGPRRRCGTAALSRGNDPPLRFSHKGWVQWQGRSAVWRATRSMIRRFAHSS